jgi:hypothetical protein
MSTQNVTVSFLVNGHVVVVVVVAAAAAAVCVRACIFVFVRGTFDLALPIASPW